MYQQLPLATRAREGTRSIVRELFAFFILGTFAAFLFLAHRHPASPEDQLVFPAIVFSVVLFFPAWALYRLGRFAIG